MSTITISTLPSQLAVYDNSAFIIETSGITNQVSGATLKDYLTVLPSLTVFGDVNATLTTAFQPNITQLGTLVGIDVSGQITSSAADGTAPLVVTSKTLVDNLYVERAALADVATTALNAVALDTDFVSVASSDVIITGNAGNISAQLRTVNSNVGSWGGKVGSTLYVPLFNVNEKGLVTSAGNVEVDLDLATQTVTSIQGTANQIEVTQATGDVTIQLPNVVSVPTITASAIVSNSLTVDGTLVAGTVQAATIGNVGATLTGTLNTPQQPEITQVGVLEGLTVSGVVAGTIFSGSGASLTNIPNSALANSSLLINGVPAELGTSATVPAAAETLTGTTLSPSVLRSNIAELGTLSSLNVVGTATVSGNVSATALFDNGMRVITTSRQIAGVGIGITAHYPYGPTTLATIYNTGVISLLPGAGISLDDSTGNITVTNSGVTAIAGNSGISVTSTTGPINVYPTAGYNGYGVRTVSTNDPSGGSDGDIWYKV